MNRPTRQLAKFFLPLSVALLTAACGGEDLQGPVAPTNGGPLGGLNAARAQRVTYTFEGGKRVDVLHFDNDHVQVSASCAGPTGQLQCQAMDALRGGKTLQLGVGDFSGGANPGAIGCKKMGRVNTTGRGPKGDEDGFCEFPDGSFVSTGSIEFYVVK